MAHICRKTFTLSLSYLGVLLVFTSAEEPMLLLWEPVAAAAVVAMLIRHARLPRIALPRLAGRELSLASATNSPVAWNDVWTGRLRVVPNQEAG